MPGGWEQVIALVLMLGVMLALVGVVIWRIGPRR